MKTQTIPFETFAGLDLDRQPFLATKTPDGRLTASTATNVLIDQISGEVIKSPGSSVFVDAATATGEVILKWMEYKYQSGERKYIVRTSGGFYLLNAAMTGWTSMNGVTGLPADTVPGGQGMQIPSYAQIGRHMVIVDGNGTYYWDGESTNLQSTRTMEAPHAWAFNGERPKLEITSTASTLTANTYYDVWMTFYSSASGDSPPLHCGKIRTGPSNKAIKVYTGYGNPDAATGDGFSGEGTGRAAVPKGATHMRFWVAGHNTTKKHYLFLSYAFDSSATVGDEIVKEIITPSTATELTEFQGAPGGVNVVVEHGGRAWYTGSPGWPIRIWWSEVDQPFKLLAQNWMDIGQLNDPVVSLVSFPYGTPMLGILKRDSVYTLSGFDDGSLLTGLQPVSERPGCLAPHAVGRVDDTVYYWGSGGIYQWVQGGKPELISQGIRSAFLDAIKGAA